MATVKSCVVGPFAVCDVRDDDRLTDLAWCNVPLTTWPKAPQPMTSVSVSRSYAISHSSLMWGFSGSVLPQMNTQPIKMYQDVYLFGMSPALLRYSQQTQVVYVCQQPFIPKTISTQTDMPSL